jgi:4-hydroxy-2-oxoglutarate aldolase
MSEEQQSAVPCGIYCPIITFFTNDDNQDLDLARQIEHVKFLLDSGIHGLVVHGTTGESVLLSTEERNALTKLVSKLRDEAKKPTPVVVGCSAQSTRETLKMCADAHANGGDFALVLPPWFWVKAATPAMIESFYTEVRLQPIYRRTVD